MSSNIKVVDINEEAKLEPIEEAKEEVIEEAKPEQNEVVEEVKQEAPTEEVKKEVVEEAREEVMVEKKIKAQDKLVRCPKCSREMKMKSFRYGHQQKCQGGLENTPVKPFSKPRAKLRAQPKIENVVEAPPPVKALQEVSNQVFKPTPVHPQLSPYEVARQSYIQMKEEVRQKKNEKINSFKPKMF